MFINLNKQGDTMNNKLSTNDVAKLLNVSIMTIRNYMKKGMPYDYFGYRLEFDKDEVITFVKTLKRKQK